MVCAVSYTFTVKPLQPPMTTVKPLPYIHHFIWIPSNCPYNTIVTIFYLPKPTISIAEPIKVCPVIDGFRERSLYTSHYIHAISRCDKAQECNITQNTPKYSTYCLQLYPVTGFEVQSNASTTRHPPGKYQRGHLSFFSCYIN